MPKTPSSLDHIYGSGITKVGGLYLLQQLIERGDLTFSEIMNEDIYASGTTLAQRLREAEKQGTIKKKVTNIPGERAKIYYSITPDGRKAAPLVLELEKILQKSKSEVKI